MLANTIPTVCCPVSFLINLRSLTFDDTNFDMLVLDPFLSNRLHLDESLVTKIVDVVGYFLGARRLLLEFVLEVILSY